MRSLWTTFRNPLSSLSKLVKELHAPSSLSFLSLIQSVWALSHNLASLETLLTRDSSTLFLLQLLFGFLWWNSLCEVERHSQWERERWPSVELSLRSSVCHHHPHPLICPLSSPIQWTSRVSGSSFTPMIPDRAKPRLPSPFIRTYLALSTPFKPINPYPQLRSLLKL